MLKRIQKIFLKRSIDKNLETSENRLMMLRDPKFNDGLSPNQKKLNEKKPV